MFLQAIIFDVDGTLAETEDLHRRAFNEAFADAGLDWRWDPALYGELLKVTGGKERIAHHAAHHRPWRPPPPEAEVRALHAAKTERYAELVRAGAMAYRPGVARLVGEARQAGVRLAIATTTSRANVDTLLAHARPKLDAAAFKVVVAGDEVSRKKPSPEVYREALRRLGLPAARCVAIEDSENGVLSARGAGIAVLATPSAYTAGDNLSGAFAIVPDLDGAGAGAEGARESGPITLALLDRRLALGPEETSQEETPGHDDIRGRAA